ncbi:MAG: CAP domain-containing protein [Candidatus Pacebacteria bacterium]|nr:CAP domain-containing protein [Candidatus Paceibacterota bacterium]
MKKTIILFAVCFSVLATTVSAASTISMRTQMNVSGTSAPVAPVPVQKPTVPVVPVIPAPAPVVNVPDKATPVVPSVPVATPKPVVPAPVPVPVAKPVVPVPVPLPPPAPQNPVPAPAASSTNSVGAASALAPTDAELRMKNEIFVATNNARTAVLGSSRRLASNATLDKVAAERAADMFKYQYFSHSSPDGKTMVNLVNQYGYRWWALGENLAWGTYSTGAQIVNSWMNSPGHKANILSASYAEIGIAAAYGNFKGRNVWIAVQVFARPR